MAPNFEELQQHFATGKILLPSDESFDKSLERWSATNKRPAAAVFQPKTAAEVSAAVRFAVANSLRFAVHGRGHNPSGESSAPTPDAVVLDLSQMRSVTVDPSAKTVTFAGGCTWADVDTALWEHGLATVGGTVSHTGVGGLILGGGYGLLSGQHGMSVDILLSCEVVLANGDIVTASETEHPDLFWALRGAGTSFGAVTSFTLRAFPQGEVWAGFLMWPYGSELLDSVGAFVSELVERRSGKHFFMPLATCDPATGTRMVGARIFYDGPAEEATAFFSPVLQLQPCVLNTTGMVPFPAANAQMDSMAAHGRRYMFGGASFSCPLDLQLWRDAAEEFYAHLAASGNEDIRTSVMALEVISQEKIVEFGKLDKTAFSGRSGNFNAAFLMAWDTPERDATVRDIVDKTGAIFRAKAQTAPEGGAESYFNYLNPGLPADKALMRTARLFGDKAPRLREIKSKYDPANVFQKNVNLMPVTL